MKQTISAVISAYNEEQNLKDCLESVKWCDEIIVIDNESSDRTADIAKDTGAGVFSRPNNLMLNINKNYGFEKAAGDWILNLDADERVTPELKEEIISIFNAQSSMLNPQINGYWLPRKNILLGKWMEHSIWFPDKQLRLFKKGQGRFPEKHIHEHLEVKGDTLDLKNFLLHLNYTSVSQFVHKMADIYTESEVENYLNNGKKLAWQEALKAPVVDFQKNYFALEGWKDGMHGLVINLLQAFYAEITLAKIWEKEGFWEQEIPLAEIKKEMEKNLRDLHYWLLTSEIKEAWGLNKIILKIKRRLICL